MNGLIEWILFVALSAVAVITALLYVLTLSMYRAGLTVMASFVAVAGLLFLLEADLLAVMLFMMGIGSMLLMILFMVMEMPMPGGEMMWQMKRQLKLPWPGAMAFHLPQQNRPEETANGEQNTGADGVAEREEASGPQNAGERSASEQKRAEAERAGQRQGDGKDGGDPGVEQRAWQQMSPPERWDRMWQMGMQTSQLPWAIGIALLVAALVIVLVVGTPWPVAEAAPTREPEVAVGELLLSRYMIGMEAAAVLILSGMVGAVILGKREEEPEERPVAGRESVEAADAESEATAKAGAEGEDGGER